ncbi:Homeobox protein onecut [Papilio xuthus]|uniref:One cut domain family member n=1 Tax=Papilio xuthus TaxID=66420 RepID=A0A194PVS5_PAPXU|nr:Homeobox protein onecut [Papilio xuthus]
MDETRMRERAPLTVIVAPSHASPPRLSPDLLPDGDAAFHPLAAVNGRLTPPGLEPASYATLTPLLPLPPISTVSDKFAYHAGGTFTVIQHQQSYSSLSPNAYNEPLSPQSAYSRRSVSPGSYERRSPTPPLPSPGLDLNAALLAREEQAQQQVQVHDTEEINTKELAQRISGELKRYSIPQAIFAQRVLCRSQGTLSDLLRNPKPWSKLKSGRETFRRMWKWLQEPEFQRMSALRLADTPHQTIKGDNVNNMQQSYCAPRDYPGAPPPPQGSGLYPGPPPHWDAPVYEPAGDMSCLCQKKACRKGCKRKEEMASDTMPSPKKPRLVFTDLQRRTLQAIFKETKRPSKEMQVTIARQLGLEPTTVGNFFMNARRRSMDKWKDDDAPSTELDQQCESHDLDHVPSLDSADSEEDHDDPDDHLL